MDYLNDLLALDFNESISQTQVTDILSHPPFIEVDGLINPRDLNDGSLTVVKKGLAFRSGSLEALTRKGKEQLKALGIKTIIDLRAADEIAEFPDPEIEGVSVLTTNTNREWNRNEGDTGVGKVGGNVLANMYLKMIETNAGTFRDLLSHVRDNPGSPFLFHCTAGKDRTGAAAGLLLAVAGAPREYISRDFALTRIGTEPFRDLLTMKLTGGKAVDLNDETVKWKLQTLGSSKAEVMTAFLENIEEKYGDVESCVKCLFDFDDRDIAAVRGNLVAS